MKNKLKSLKLKAEYGTPDEGNMDLRCIHVLTQIWYAKSFAGTIRLQISTCGVCTPSAGCSCSRWSLPRSLSVVCMTSIACEKTTRNWPGLAVDLQSQTGRGRWHPHGLPQSLHTCPSPPMHLLRLYPSEAHSTDKRAIGAMLVLSLGRPAELADPTEVCKVVGGFIRSRSFGVSHVATFQNLAQLL